MNNKTFILLNSRLNQSCDVQWLHQVEKKWRNYFFINRPLFGTFEWAHHWVFQSLLLLKLLKVKKLPNNLIPRKIKSFGKMTVIEIFHFPSPSSTGSLNFIEESWYKRSPHASLITFHVTFLSDSLVVSTAWRAKS